MWTLAQTSHWTYAWSSSTFASAYVYLICHEFRLSIHEQQLCYGEHWWQQQQQQHQQRMTGWTAAAAGGSCGSSGVAADAEATSAAAGAAGCFGQCLVVGLDNQSHVAVQMRSINFLQVSAEYLRLGKG
jgi:hypothetical protein